MLRQPRGRAAAAAPAPGLFTAYVAANGCLLACTYCDATQELAAAAQRRIKRTRVQARHLCPQRFASSFPVPPPFLRTAMPRPAHLLVASISELRQRCSSIRGLTLLPHRDLRSASPCQPARCSWRARSCSARAAPRSSRSGAEPAQRGACGRRGAAASRAQQQQRVALPAKAAASWPTYSQTRLRSARYVQAAVEAQSAVL